SKGMALSPDESKLYVSNWITSDISEFDLATGEKTHSWSVAATPRGLFTVPSGQKLLIASFGAGLIEALDLQSQARETIFNSEGAMRHFAYDKQQQLLYVSDMKNNAIYRAKLPDGKWEFFVRTESHPNTIKLTPDGKILAISNRGVNGPKWPGPGATWGAIMLIDTSNGKILDVIVGGNQCTGLDISSDGKTLAFSDFNDDRIHLIDLPSYEELLKYNGGRLKSYAKDLKKVTTFNKISR
ncbi:MAG: hypothetical protein JW841_05835, partial [Deltaproteobacteria bacterium]|nr:hypothetical protein [Deltaproteobacteria bacterium]